MIVAAFLTTDSNAFDTSGSFVGLLRFLGGMFRRYPEVQLYASVQARSGNEAKLGTQPNAKELEREQLGSQPNG